MSMFSLIYCQKDENELFWNRTNSFYTNTIISLPKEKCYFCQDFVRFDAMKFNFPYFCTIKYVGLDWG